MCASTSTNPTALAVGTQRAGFGMYRAGFASFAPRGFKAIGAKTISGVVPAFCGRQSCLLSVRSELTIKGFVSVERGTSEPANADAAPAIPNRFSTLEGFLLGNPRGCIGHGSLDRMDAKREPAKDKHRSVFPTGSVRVSSIGKGVGGLAVTLTERAIRKQRLDKVNS